MPAANVEKPTQHRKMMNARTLTYALILGFIAAAPLARAMDPLDHQPIADLRTALQNAGQVRIAQGIEDVVAHDPETGKVFNARAPLMLTTNSKTGAWTITVLNDQNVGTTLLIGENLRAIQTTQPEVLSTFSKEKTEQMAGQTAGNFLTFYPDDIKRVSKLNYQRIYTGKVTVTTIKEFTSVTTPCFADIVVNNEGRYMIILVDQNGASTEIAWGHDFSQKS